METEEREKELREALDAQRCELHGGSLGNSTNGDVPGARFDAVRPDRDLSGSFD